VPTAPARGAATVAPTAQATTALAVDEEPEEAAVRAMPRIAPPPFEGAVLPSGDVVASVVAPDEVDDDDVIPPADEADLPVP
ncbi:hypothetical protein ABTH88_21880, partial [Acinetobacter baumannii]